MDRFQCLEVFLEVADTSSFAQASRNLSMSPPAVTRAISVLEERMGVRLFERTTRSVRLSETGDMFIDDARRILNDLKDAEEAARGSFGLAQGTLLITAPVLFGQNYIAPLLPDLLKDHEMLNVQTLFLDRVVNLQEEGVDLAIRIGPLADSSMRAIRVGRVKKVTCASPKYLKSNGVPKNPKDLEKFDLIHPESLGRSDKWYFMDKKRKIDISIKPRAILNTNEAVIKMLKEGFGISQLLSYQVGPYLKNQEIDTILEQYEEPELPIHLLHAQGRLVSAKTRTALDFFVDRLRSNSNLQLN